jgi:hypothetical protein
MAATGAAYRDRDMFPARSLGFDIPLAENPQPPAEVTPAIGARRTLVWADREIDLPSGMQEFVRDLNPRGPRTDHQHHTIR